MSFARKYLPFVALAIVSNVSSSRSAEGFVVRPAKDPNKLGNELRNIMQKHCGVFRSPDLLKKGVFKIRIPGLAWIIYRNKKAIGSMDFFGLNYYSHNHVKFKFNPKEFNVTSRICNSLNHKYNLNFAENTSVIKEYGHEFASDKLSQLSESELDGIAGSGCTINSSLCGECTKQATSSPSERSSLFLTTEVLRECFRELGCARRN